MMARLIVGLAIVLNVALMIGGIVWAKRQVKRVAAERAIASRSLSTLEPLPPPGDAVDVVVEGRGRT